MSRDIDWQAVMDKSDRNWATYNTKASYKARHQPRCTECGRFCHASDTHDYGTPGTRYRCASCVEDYARSRRAFKAAEMQQENLAQIEAAGRVVKQFRQTFGSR